MHRSNMSLKVTDAIKLGVAAIAFERFGVYHVRHPNYLIIWLIIIITPRRRVRPFYTLTTLPLLQDTNGRIPCSAVRTVSYVLPRRANCARVPIVRILVAAL
jgi:hypothetical protein